MTAGWIALVLENFSLAMFIVAIFISLFQTHFFSAPAADILFRWTALLAVGISGIYTFVLHVFYPELSAATIGWHPSPFQYEAGIADLMIGVLGMTAFTASRDFRVATVIAVCIWMWGDATGHIHQMLQHHDYKAGNAGSWFWMDLVLPLVLWVTQVKSGNHEASLPCGHSASTLPQDDQK